MPVAAVATATSPLWYATRATGLTALVLLTASVLLGVLTSVRFARPAWPRFVTVSLHRNVSLLAVTFTGLHVVTTVTDPYASISVISAVVPFTSPYRRIWLGLGAVAFDLLLAVLITSLFRARVGLRTWRLVHWAGYLCWPIALIHALGTGTDGAARWVLAVIAACAVAVAAAGAWRLAAGWPAHAALRAGVAAAAVLFAIGAAGWMRAGPLSPGWARRAGTPAALLARSGGAGGASSVRSGQSAFPAPPFQLQVAGTVTMANGPGSGGRTVTIAATSGSVARLRIVISGPAIAGGVEMTGSQVSLGPPAAPVRYTGHVVSLDGTAMQATVAGAGQRLVLTIDLAQSGASVTGTLTASSRLAQGDELRRVVTVEMPVVEDAGTPGAPGPAGLPRLLPPAAVPGLRAHDTRYGPVRLHGDALIAEVERAGLTGRGGAAFPAGKKLRSVAARARRGAVLIANGMESEPVSGKDAALLARVPHLVLDGIALAAAAVSADRAYLCVHRPAQAETLAAAVADRSGRDPVPVTVTLLPARYTASEASALVHHINGGPALPLFTPPRPSERGVRGLPTLVSNVETLANVALISRYGADWFRSLGVCAAPGSALVTLSGAVPRPGVWEIALGTPLRDVLALSGAGVPGVQAVLTGGYYGTWLAGAAALDAPASAAGLSAAGGAFGAGIMLVLPPGGCGLAETARVARYLAGQSAGQCGPCLRGLPEIAAALERLAFGGASGRSGGRAVRDLHQLSGLVAGRGACHLPDGVARLVASALRVFSDDVRRHERGPCAGARGRPVFPVPASEYAGSTN